MKKAYDYIVVGRGLAGINFCEELRRHGKTFIVFDDNSQKSSTVAGGLYNPVILKRFTTVWKSELQLKLVLERYQELEALLNVTLDYKLPVYRKFTSIEEQNNWFTASDKPRLTHYLAPKINSNTNAAIKAPFGLGEVLHTGRIDVKRLLEAYHNFLNKQNAIIEEAFHYASLEHLETGVRYKTIAAKHIVFAEGYGVVKNPFFELPTFRPTKGEVLTIHAPDLKLKAVLKGPVFLIPIGADCYTVGATYERVDLSHNTTEKAEQKLLEGLASLIDCPFKIVDHVAGVRPTVADRRPLVGRHKVHKHIYLLNGLGTRGIMIGPDVAKQLYAFITHNAPLDPEIDIARLG
jgi:glycine/D-amino acid oxidase-like deaminating enzyme